MLALRLVDTAPIPGESAELGLYQRGQDYFITIVGGQDLMNTRAHASEDALGAVACRKLRTTAAPRVLIGGLGMGFTLAAALKALPPDAEVVVAEIVPGIVEWNRGVLGPFAGHPLDDARTRLHVGDVAELIGTDPGSFDGVVLDVDNGPDGLTRASNQWLYSRQGLSALRATLRPLGVLAVWSASPDRAFTKRMRSAGFSVEEITVRAHAGKGSRHVIWLARRGREHTP